MLRGNGKFPAVIKSFISMSCRLMKSWFSWVSYIISWEKWYSKEERPVKSCYKKTCASLLYFLKVKPLQSFFIIAR